MLFVEQWTTMYSFNSLFLNRLQSSDGDRWIWWLQTLSANLSWRWLWLVTNEAKGRPSFFFFWWRGGGGELLLEHTLDHKTSMKSTDHMHSICVIMKSLFSKCTLFCYANFEMNCKLLLIFIHTVYEVMQMISCCI